MHIIMEDLSIVLSGLGGYAMLMSNSDDLPINTLGKLPKESIDKLLELMEKTPPLSKEIIHYLYPNNLFDVDE